MSKKKDVTTSFTPLKVPVMPAPSASMPVAAAAETGARPPSRFAMFVHLYNECESPFPGKQRKWTFRGDAYDNHHPAKQLRYLLSKLNNYCHTYHVAYITDNAIPKESGEQLVLKLHKGVVTAMDGIDRYPELLQGYPIPNFLKKYIEKW